MQLLLRDSRQHATDLLADNQLLQQSQDRLQKALAQVGDQSQMLPCTQTWIQLPFSGPAHACFGVVRQVLRPIVMLRKADAMVAHHNAASHLNVLHCIA